MSELDRDSHPLPNVKRYVILLALLWTVLIGCLAVWDIHQVHRQGGVSILSESLNEANRAELFQHSVVFAVIWLTGISGIVFSGRSLSRRVFKQKKTEGALRASEARLRRLMEHLPQRIFHKDVNGVYVSCNKHYADDLGILPEEIAGKTDFDFHPHELAEKYLADDLRLMESGKTEEIEESYIKDGQEILIQTVKTPLTDVESNSNGILGIFRDITDRKKTDEALRISEERFSKAFRCSPNTIMLSRLSDGLIIEVNDAYEEMYGISRDEVIGRTTIELGMWADPNIRDDVFLPLSEGRGIRNVEIRSCRSSGEFFDILLSAEVIEINGEESVLTNFRDITDHKRAEEAVRRSEDLLNATQRLAKIGGWEWDVEKETMYWTDEVFRIHDLEADDRDNTEESIQKSLGCYDPEDRLVLINAFHRCKETGQAYDLEFPFTTLKGRRIWIRTVTESVMEGSRVVKVVGSLMDITDRKLAEEALRVSDERFSKAFHNSPDMILITRMSDGLIIEVNEVCEEMSQMTRESVLGKKITEIGAYPEGISREELVSKIRQDGKFKNFEFHFMRPSGVTLDVLLSGEMIEIDGEECILTVIRDITERKRAQEVILASEQQLKASNQQLKSNECEREGLLKILKFKNRELQDIVYTASHDLKSPLVNISGFSGYLAMSCQELQELIDHIDDPSSLAKIKDSVTTEIPESLGFITSSVGKMKSLIDGLLRISRIGSAEMNVCDVEMNVLLEQVHGAMGYQLQESVCRFHVGALPVCRGDVGLLNQVFTNLIDNAIKYRESSRDCEIEVSGEIVGGEAVYCVRDNGVGVEEAFQGKVFEIFHRLNPDGGIDGEGLGLTIVTRIVDRLGGRIWMESEAGVGCEFFVALPKGGRKSVKEKV